VPELPEVESLRQALAAKVVGRTIESIEINDGKLRWPVDGAQLRRLVRHRRVEACRRRGKYLLLDVSGESVLLVHLGMTGRLTLDDTNTPHHLHDRVTFGLGQGQELRLRDPRRFGFVTAFAKEDEPAHPRLKVLGLEPLSPEFCGQRLFAMTRGRSRAIKLFLMDHTELVGVGNIYACEALFLAKLDPFRAAQSLTVRDCTRLARSVRRVLCRAIAAGGTTLQDYVGLYSEPGKNGNFLRVYGREDQQCLRCKAVVNRRAQGGRSTFYCERCQT
jgi:formamidopyrimidine-DNA glycosylase